MTKSHKSNVHRRPTFDVHKRPTFDVHRRPPNQQTWSELTLLVNCLSGRSGVDAVVELKDLGILVWKVGPCEFVLASATWRCASGCIWVESLSVEEALLLTEEDVLRWNC